MVYRNYTSCSKTTILAITTDNVLCDSRAGSSPMNELTGLTDEIVTICSSDDFYVAVDIRGEVWVKGANLKYQLGMRALNVATFTKIPNVSSITMVSCGTNHTLLLDSNGDVWGMGGDHYHQVISTHYAIGFVAQIPISGVKMISAGDSASMFLDMQGDVHVVGQNRTRQLGLRGHPISSITRIKQERLPPVEKISLGLRLSLLLDINGDVWRNDPFGFFSKVVCTNDKGDSLCQLKFIDVSVNADNYFLLDEDGNIWKDNSGEECKIFTQNTWNVHFTHLSQNSCSSTAAAFIDNEHKLWALGKTHMGNVFLQSPYKPTLARTSLRFGPNNLVVKSARK